MTDNLRDEIQTGWSVKITDHDYISDSRDDVTVTAITADGLTLKSKRGWSSQGRKYPTMRFTWDGDREIDGHTVRLYHTPPLRTHKVRRLIKTFVFSPPIA
jgi:hypothetical protein